MGIEAGGECITDLRERQAVLGVLRITEIEYAWPDGGIAERLRGVWEGSTFLFCLSHQV
jgi:hypothetical protein